MIRRPPRSTRTDTLFPYTTLFRSVPIFGNIGEVGVTDDDQQIKIGLIAVLRIIDPVAATITAEQDDLLDLAVLLPRLRRARGRNGKFVHQNPRSARPFFLLRRGQMVRSEERRVGKECVITCNSRGASYHSKQQTR